jgi:hypothetical protein
MKKAKRFDAGGLSDAQKEWLGGADATDPYILARMRAAVPDEASPVKSREQVQDEQEGYSSAPKSVERTVVKTKVTPKSEPLKITKDDQGNKMPTDVKKPYIAIPKNAAGMQQFRSDAESPAERLFKALTSSKSQRSTAAGMKKGGFVSHSDHVKQHAAGFKHHDDHVKAMCGGGMTKKKK